MKQLALTRVLMALSPEHRKQAMAALEAAADPNDQLNINMKSFSVEKFRQAMAVRTPEYRTASTAQQILAAAAAARGEAFDPESIVDSPPQGRVRVTAQEIIKAARLRRGDG